MKLRINRLSIAAGAVILAAGCAAPGSAVRVDTIEGQLPACNTFTWNPQSTGDAASMTDQRVRNAVMQTLQSKGYTEATDKADCRIAYQLNTQQVAQAKPRVGVGMGGGSYGGGVGVGVSLPIGKKKGEHGTFTIDVIDSAKNAQVWSGSVDTSFDSAELSDAEAKSAVEAVLARYPDHGRK